jgi:putative transcriptional regulator
MAAIVSAGRLLVATPALGDPNFSRAVVLLLEHNASGSLGVIINRPTELSVSDVLGPWSGLVAEPDVVFQGGPVGLDGALAIAALSSRARVGDREPAGWRRVFGDLGLVDLDTAPEQLVGELGAVRVFAGYAGWGAGQLADELAEEAWIVLDSEPFDAFSARPERLWTDVLRRQEGELAFVATCPADPRMN